MPLTTAKIALYRIRNEHSPMPKTAKILNLPKHQEKAGEHVFWRKTAKNEQIRVKDGARTGKNTGENMTTALLNLVEELSQERQKQNAQCRKLAKKILCNKEIAYQLMHSTMQDRGRYALAFEMIINELDSGEEINVTELTESLAKTHQDLSIRFLKDKAKTLLEEQGILVKKEDKKIRWANLDELQNHRSTVDQNDKTIDQPSIKTFISSIKPKQMMRTLIQKQQLKRAMDDPYFKVNADGSIERVSTILTEKRKKLIRDRDAAKQEADLIEETAKLKDKKLQRELREVQITQQIQTQGIITEGQAQVAEIEVRRMINKAKFQSYKPAVAVLVVLAIFFFIKSNQVHNVSIDHVDIAQAGQ